MIIEKNFGRVKQVLKTVSLFGLFTVASFIGCKKNESNAINKLSHHVEKSGISILKELKKTSDYLGYHVYVFDKSGIEFELGSSDISILTYNPDSIIVGYGNKNFKITKITWTVITGKRGFSITSKELEGHMIPPDPTKPDETKMVKDIEFIFSKGSIKRIITFEDGSTSTSENPL